MNAVQIVKDICKERKIPISRLEKDLGFGNAYISQLKRGCFPYARAVSIAKYLNIPESLLLTGEEEQKENPGIPKDTEVDEVTMQLMDIIQNSTLEDRQVVLEMFQMLKRRGKR